MGRRHSNFVAVSGAAAILGLSVPLAQAQPPGPQGPPPRRIFVPHRAPEMKSQRDRWFAMPPDERQALRRNAERWMQMSPEERKLMREREKAYRERIQREIDATLRDSGLRLEGEKRELFEQRYLQERRRIEHSLREEIDAKRQQELPALQERLKKEFQETSPAPAVGTPTSSASPKK